MRCSIRYWAVFIDCGLPDMVTIRLRVPGAKIPFFDIWMLAPLSCWISTNERPPGPETEQTTLTSLVYRTRNANQAQLK